MLFLGNTGFTEISAPMVFITIAWRLHIFIFLHSGSTMDKFVIPGQIFIFNRLLSCDIYCSCSTLFSNYICSVPISFVFALPPSPSLTVVGSDAKF